MRAEPPPARLFELIWNSLCDVLGSAATATLLRRSKKAASAHGRELEQLVIMREGLEYRYVTPDEWNTDCAAGLAALGRLVVELRPLLFELTGLVVIQRLGRIPELARLRFEGDQE